MMCLDYIIPTSPLHYFKHTGAVHPPCRWCGGDDHNSDIHLTCEYCGADGLNMPCHNVDCFSGRILVSGSLNSEYEEKSTFLRHTREAILDNTSVDESSIGLVLEYLCPVTRYCPLRIPDAYIPLMRDAFFRCGPLSFASQYDSIWRRVMARIMNGNCDRPPLSWFHKMCAYHSDKLDHQFPDKAMAELCALLVWNNECDEEGQSVYSICLDEWRNVMGEYGDDVANDDDDDDDDDDGDGKDNDGVDDMTWDND
jgi:hypothetical protein